jgi:hypothetical protein
MLRLQIREILLKGLSDCRLALSQGIHLIKSYIEADCAIWKSERDHDDNPRLTRKFHKWRTENFIHSTSLVMSVMHPISLIRVESHVAILRLKELPRGFRVLSSEESSIESLSEEKKKLSIAALLSSQTNHPENVCCVALFELEDLHAANSCFLCEGYGFGDYSDLASIQENAATVNGHQAELIEMLNKEV